VGWGVNDIIRDIFLIIRLTPQPARDSSMTVEADTNSATAGAPEADIVVTPEMIAAGAERLYRSLPDAFSWRSSALPGLAVEVFAAMAEARQRGDVEVLAAWRLHIGASPLHVGGTRRFL
jgi:hypothetical protein